jgi:XTP/dITP diphosphohydrolase
MKIVLASGNRGKLEELRALLAPLGIAWSARRRWASPPPETRATFIENALDKARHAARHTGPAGPGRRFRPGGARPRRRAGHHSARYAGDQADDGANNAKLVAALAGLETPAHYYCALVYLRSPGRSGTADRHRALARRDLREPRGSGGFGYDPLFLCPSSAHRRRARRGEKNRMSHRGRAMAAAQQLRDEPARRRDARSGCTCTFPGACANAPTATSIPTRSAARCRSAEYLAALRADAAVALADLPQGDRPACSSAAAPPACSGRRVRRADRRLAPLAAADAEITMEANPGTAEHHDLRRLPPRRHQPPVARRPVVRRRHAGGWAAFTAPPTPPGHGLARAGRLRQHQHRPDVRPAGADRPGAAPWRIWRPRSRSQPEHLSWYQLTIEPKTEFARRPPLLASRRRMAQMERQAMGGWPTAGFRRYEVSAYARPGRRAVTTWLLDLRRLRGSSGPVPTASEPAGDGRGADRAHPQGHPSRACTWPPRRPRRRPSPRRAGVEFLMNALRLVDGVEWAPASRRTGLARRPGAAVERWSKPRAWCAKSASPPPPLGYRHLDGVLERFL